MNNVNIIKAIQCLIGSNCLVSTPETFYVGPKGYVSNTSLQGSIEEHSNSIDAILKELVNKITEEDLKTINGISLVGEGNIEISGQGGSVDLSGYLTKKDANDLYPSKNSVVYNTESILDVSKLHIKKHNGETFEDYNGSLQGGKDLWISKDSYQELYDFLSQKQYNALLYDGHLYYSIIGMYIKESSKEVYDNALTVLLVNKDTLYLFTLGETSIISEDYPVAIKLEVFVNQQAVAEANSYTNQKISKLDPQHVNITNNYKELSKQSNVGRLVYLTKDTPISFMFISSTGMPFYTKIYNPSSSNETINNVDAYSDAFLTNKIETQTEGFGDLLFTNYMPNALYPFTGNSLSYYKTFVVTSGLYYLPNVNDPILIASEESILKLNEAITETEAREILISKNRLKYITGTISLNTLKSQGIYELYLDDMYQGTYYNNIAYLIKVGTKVFVQGLVRVDDYGVVYINPSSYTSNWYQNTYSNRWVKFIDPDIDSLNNSLQEHINITDNKFLGIQNALNNYYVIDSVEEWENTNPKIGDMVEMQVLTIPTHKYHVWKSNAGEIIYSDDFDLSQVANISPSIYSDRYFRSLLDGAWNYEVDEAGRKHVLADEYKDRAPFYYVKTIDSSINDELGRRVSILTSLGYRKVAELF